MENNERFGHLEREGCQNSVLLSPRPCSTRAGVRRGGRGARQRTSEKRVALPPKKRQLPLKPRRVGRGCHPHDLCHRRCEEDGVRERQHSWFPGDSANHRRAGCSASSPRRFLREVRHVRGTPQQPIPAKRTSRMSYRASAQIRTAPGLELRRRAESPGSRSVDEIGSYLIRWLAVAWRPRSTGSTSTRVRLRSGSSRTQLSASAIRAQTSTLPQRGKSLRSTVDGPLRPATDRDENQLGAYRGAWTPTACAGSACESPSPMSSAKSAFLVGLMGLIDGAGVTVL